MIFELVKDFSAAIAAMPADHPRNRNLCLLEEAIRRDVHFISRHPTTLFQCMWNTCWWYDCDDAEAHYEPHYEPPSGGWPTLGPPWQFPLEQRLCSILESWRRAKEAATPGFPWLRCHRPPPMHLTRRRRSNHSSSFPPQLHLPAFPRRLQTFSRRLILLLLLLYSLPLHARAGPPMWPCRRCLRWQSCRRPPPVSSPPQLSPSSL